MTTSHLGADVIVVRYTPTDSYMSFMQKCDICLRGFRWKDECIWGRFTAPDDDDTQGDICRQCYMHGADWCRQRLHAVPRAGGRPPADDGTTQAVDALMRFWHHEGDRRRQVMLAGLRFRFDPEPGTEEFHRLEREMWDEPA